MRTFRRFWLPCFGKKKKEKLNSLCPQKYEHIKWDLSPMQPCTIIQVSSSRSCMACKYTFNRKNKISKIIDQIVPYSFFWRPRSRHVRFYSSRGENASSSKETICVCDHACWTVTFIGQDYFSPFSAFYMHSQTTLGNDHKAMWLTEGGDFTTWTQQRFCGFVFPKSHLFCGSCLI